MYKKTLCLCLSLALFLSLSACGNIFDREYLYVSSYADNYGTADEAQKIADGSELKAAVLGMVARHIGEEKFIFTAYDGDLQTDLAQLGWQIKSEDALSGYCVDYLSYDLSRIVNYYEAKIQISYKHTEPEVSAISPVSDADSLRQGIARALQNCETHAAFRWSGDELSDEAASDAAWQAYSQNPALCAVTPVVTVSLYYTGDSVGIAAFDFDYGYASQELQDMKAALESAISAVVREELGEGEARLRALCSALADSGEYSPNYGVSAYDALVIKSASSEGMALGLSALCNELSIECHVVRGEYYGEEHLWCIVALDEHYYHLDPSADFALRSDSQTRSAGYRWNAGTLPLCSN